MIVSTRGRYALHVLLDLAEHSGGEFVPLKDIAVRENISHKYLESIMTVLSKAGMVEGVHGRGGGYRLNRPPGDYSLGEVLRLTEGDLAPVPCVAHGTQRCAEAGQCRTFPVWNRLNELINGYLDGITLEDLIEKEA